MPNFSNMQKYNAPTLPEGYVASLIGGYSELPPIGHCNMELKQFLNECVWVVFSASQNRDIVADLVFDACNQLEIGFSENNCKLLAYYQSKEKKERGIRTPIKAAKLFRKVIPNMPDQFYSDLYDSYVKEFDKDQFEYRVGSGPDEFERVFRMRHFEFSNPATDYYRKSLANSCMGGHKDFESQKKHPCAAYGSNDFEIHYLIAPDGRLGARSVVNIARNGIQCDPTNAPIYGVSELTLDTLQNHLTAKGIEKADGWSGATLLALYEGNKRYALPYLDISPTSLEPDDDSDPEYFIMRRQGAMDDNNYSGTRHLEGPRSYCECCGDYGPEDDSCYIEGEDISVCSDCYSRHYGNCECCDATFQSGNLETVYYINSRGREDSHEYCNDCRLNHCVDETSDNQTWLLDDVIYCEYEGIYISPSDMDEYFMSDMDGEYYPNDQLALIESNGESWSIDEAESDGLELNPETLHWDDSETIAAMTAIPWKENQDSHIRLGNAVETFSSYNSTIGYLARSQNALSRYNGLDSSVITFVALNGSGQTCPATYDSEFELGLTFNCPIDGVECDRNRDCRNNACRFSQVNLGTHEMQSIAIAAE